MPRPVTASLRNPIEPPMKNSETKPNHTAENPGIEPGGPTVPVSQHPGPFTVMPPMNS